MLSRPSSDEGYVRGPEGPRKHATQRHASPRRGSDSTEEKPMRWLLILGVAVSLTGCARSTEDWVRQLKDEDVVKRRQALRELAARNTEAERLVGPLTEALRDAN